MSDSLRPHGLQHTRPPCHLRAKTIQIFIWIKIKRFIYISSVQSLSCFRLFETPWIAACQVSLSITNSQSLHKPMPIESVMPSSHLILCRPLLLPPTPPSIRVFSNESTLHMRWPNYWSFNFSISLSNKYSGLISFRMDWLDLAVQGTLKSLFQHHSSKVSILRHSTFFTVQLSHPYMTTGKTIALTRRTFVGKVMSQVFKMPSRLAIAFLPRRKRLSIPQILICVFVIIQFKIFYLFPCDSFFEACFSFLNIWGFFLIYFCWYIFLIYFLLYSMSIFCINLWFGMSSILVNILNALEKKEYSGVV